MNMPWEIQERINVFSDRTKNQISALVSQAIEEMLAAVFTEMNAQNKNEMPANPSDPSKWLKAKDIAQSLGISLSLVYRLMQNGEIKTVHIGRLAKVKPEDLEEYIRERSKK